MYRVLLYHKIDPRWEVGITRTTPQGFYRQMKALKDLGYRLLPLKELLKNPPDEKNVGLVFDDAYESVYLHALPVLRELGFGATLFVPVRFVGKKNEWEAQLFWRSFKHMNWSQLQDWTRDGNEVGSHSASHIQLSLLPQTEWPREIKESKRLLEEKLESAVTWFSPPFGWWNRELAEMLKEVGYRGLVSPWIPGGFSGITDFTVLRSHAVYTGDTPGTVTRKLSGTGAFAAVERARLRFIHAFSQGTVIVQGWRLRRRKKRKQYSSEDST